MGHAQRVAVIGLGEVGRVMVEDLRGTGDVDCAAWDVAFADEMSTASRNARDLGLPPASSAPAAVAGADLVICAVTAARSVEAARAASVGIAPGAWFVDVNSSSPGHKQQSAESIDRAGGRYVEAGLMSPIEPHRIASSFLLGGPHAAEFAADADRWGFSRVRVVSDRVGRAAATKLCRSVVVKGLEALFTESLLAARQYGVERDVLASLSNILPDADWEQIAAYFVARSVQHGVRRAEEMEEAATTVRDVGVEPWMAGATVHRQRWAAAHGNLLPGEPDLVALIDAFQLAPADREIA
ncbi:DUF1932 domain-containing protein [Flexivirga oryzae]|uniref:3-hydroxyisobutyrate dehydrogenase-like beta-hydroxyacid dehydrogenase n=1 Tax=Flexivirga oryzae TaxID=1794944 RepID=A0A839N6V0_9MICO|nr:3-hydroxyisobutyrate dehydrogenase-like beta-hydroxyacid dehydrogenase [Flexivirga oryzae]